MLTENVNIKYFVDELEKDGPGEKVMPKKSNGDLSCLIGDHKQM